jgi:O-antigen ligase
MVMIRGSWEMIQASPLLGLGLGGYNLASIEYLGFASATPHNEFASVLAAGGLLGEVMLLLLFWQLLATAWRNAIRDPIGLSLLGASVAILIAELQFNYLIRPEFALYFWLTMWGVATAMRVPGIDRAEVGGGSAQGAWLAPANSAPKVRRRRSR